MAERIWDIVSCEFFFLISLNSSFISFKKRLVWLQGENFELTDCNLSHVYLFSGWYKLSGLWIYSIVTGWKFSFMPHNFFTNFKLILNFIYFFLSLLLTYICVCVCDIHIYTRTHIRAIAVSRFLNQLTPSRSLSSPPGHVLHFVMSVYMI